MNGMKTIATSIPDSTLEWCPKCYQEKTIDSFLVTRCQCGHPLLPCSTCSGCKINEKFTACARYGVSLENESEELEALTDITYLRTRCQQIEINFLLEPELYLDLFITSMLVDLRLRGLAVDDIQMFSDQNKCATNTISSKIKLCMDRIHAEFPAIGFEQLVCLAYWECYCTGTNRSILRILQNKDKL